MIDLKDQTGPSGNGTSPGTVDTVLGDTIGRLKKGYGNTDLATALSEFGKRVPQLDPVQREVARASAVNHLASLKVRGGARMVDAALASASPNGENATTSGASILLKDTAPWPEAVDGEELFEELTKTILRYVAVPTPSALAVSLWIVFTFAHDEFHVSPLLAITSPQKRCGKTTLLLLLGALVRRMLTAASMTTSSLFRAVEKFNPTLLVDEADTFLRDNEELRGVLNSGHLRAAAHVIRSVGDDHEPKIFSTWAPKAIALIGKLPDTLQDRAIVIAMRRRAVGEKVERLRLDRLHGDLEELRRKVARWCDDNRAALATADPVVPSELNDRATDNWRPLLAIAERAGPLVLLNAKKAAVTMAAIAGDDDAPAEFLLGDIRALFTVRGVDSLSSEDIVESLVAMEDRPWPEWRRGMPLSKRGLARLLKPFGISPRGVRIGDRTPRGYKLEWFGDAFSRYLPSGSATTATTQEIREKVGFPKCNTEADVALREPGESPGKTGHVADVAVADPLPGAEGGVGPGLEELDVSFWNSLPEEVLEPDPDEEACIAMQEGA